MFWDFFKFGVKEEGPSKGRISIGKSGEDEAAKVLEKKGYKILDRNYRTRYGEVDIVARDGQTIVFVEVKKRRSNRYGSAKEAIGQKKMKRLAMAAKDYILKHSEGHAKGLNSRFDVVSIETHRDLNGRVEHVKNAFEAGD